MKTYQMSMKENTLDKGGEKGTRWVNPTPSKNKKPPIRVHHKGNMNKSNIQTPLVATNILDKEKGKTPKRTFSLEKPSLTITMCFKIKVRLLTFTITSLTPFAYKMNAKPKDESLQSRSCSLPC